MTNPNLILKTNPISIDLASIFNVEISKDQTEVIFTEACDWWFSEALNKTDLANLISHLQLIHSGLKAISND